MSRILPVVLICAALLTALVFSQRTPEEFHVSGFVEADEIRVGSRIGGRVQRVMVDEGDTVSKGEVLVELEPFDLMEKRAEANQRLAQHAAVLRKLKAGLRAEEVAQSAARREQAKAILEKAKNGPRPLDIDSAAARLEQAEAELELAQIAYKRAETSLGQKAINQSDFDEVEKQLRVARANRTVRAAELELLREGTRKEDISAVQAAFDEADAAWKLASLGYREEEIAEASATVEAAAASLAAIDQQLKELQITAPGDGTVEAIDLQPGDLISPGGPALSLLNHRQLWIRTYVPENRLNISINQKVGITVDSLPGQKFEGRISFIARQAEFTPGNIQTPEERSKQVFRMKVLLSDHSEVLRPGMAADVWFHTGDLSP
ncbi:MAG: efflux RND transporter periplasmic adaptor subunit [Planctomycetaceae bacterium]|nr:efflux RND transporter periplasmic adaptor subunit [Planctomycetaceae bacterium]